MKHLAILLVLGFALSLCNLTKRLRDATKSDSGGSSTTSTSDGSTVERPAPTAGQIAALAGGQNITWDKQGMSWSVPPTWKMETDETKMLVWSSPGPGAAFLNVSISPMSEDFPTDISINAFYDGEKTRSKNGEVDELKWLEIDGLKGVQFRESTPEHPDGIRRLQWLAYRKYAGQVQMINLMLSSEGKDFARHQDTMYGILYSTKVVH
jgi:hypothetical protein